MNDGSFRWSEQFYAFNADRQALRSSGISSASNQGLRVIQALLRQEGWGRGHICTPPGHAVMRRQSATVPDIPRLLTSAGK